MNSPGDRHSFASKAIEGMEEPDKSEYLPIEKTDFGYVQKAVYQQPDLFHEEVVDIESPFASLVPSDTQVYSFLVLGDQNAGKSTFMHAFTYHVDRNFLEITSYIPILNATFVNTRFSFENTTNMQPMDEIPFIDTDLGRVTILISAVDFQFFLEEFNITAEPMASDTRYVIIQFIEIGGDHLDSLMSKKEQLHPSLGDIVQRTHNLLMDSRKLLYFINETSLFFNQGVISFDEKGLSTLVKRLQFLDQTLPKGHQVLFYLSRIKKQHEIMDKTSRNRCVEQLRTLGIGNISVGEGEERMEHFLFVVLKEMKRLYDWKLEFVDVIVTNHLHADGSLNARGIIQTLARCFQNQMVHSIQQPEPFVVKELLECYKKETQYYATSHNLYCIYWISKEVFRDHLLETEFAEVPPTILLQKFNTVARKMLDIGMCIEFYAGNHSDLGLMLCVAGKEYLWTPIEGPASPKLLIRFPHVVPLFQVFDSYFVKNIPPELWFHEDVQIHKDQTTLTALQQATTHVENLLQENWNKVLQSLSSPFLHQVVDTFFWILEEWVLAKRMAGMATELKLPFELSLFSNQLEEVKTLFHPHRPKTIVQVQLRINDVY